MVSDIAQHWAPLPHVLFTHNDFTGLTEMVVANSRVCREHNRVVLAKGAPRYFVGIYLSETLSISLSVNLLP